MSWVVSLTHCWLAQNCTTQPVHLTLLLTGMLDSNFIQCSWAERSITREKAQYIAAQLVVILDWKERAHSATEEALALAKTQV